MTDRAFEAQLKGYALTTAEILYRLPDHPSLLLSYTAVAALVVGVVFAAGTLL